MSASSASTACFTPGDVRAWRARAAPGARPRPVRSGCCRRRSAPGSRRRRLACARRCRPPTAARSTARRRARRRPPGTPRVPASPRSSSVCCSCRCRRSAVLARRCTREHASMTARFSSSSSAVASPVVPSATIPGAPARRGTRAQPLDRVDVDVPVASNGVISGTQTPRRSRSLVMRRGYPAGPIRCGAYVRRPAVLRDAARRRRDRILSGMFGIGGAVISTPAVRALGATPSRPSARRCRRSCRRRSRARCGTREALVRNGALWTCVFGVPASVGGSLLSGAVPATATADARDGGLARFHGLSHGLPAPTTVRARPARSTSRSGRSR